MIADYIVRLSSMTIMLLGIGGRQVEMKLSKHFYMEQKIKIKQHSSSSLRANEKKSYFVNIILENDI